MADDPVQGFGGRIIARARVPVTTLLALPFFAVAFEYFFFLVGRGVSWTSAVEQIKKDFALFIFLAALPPIVLAFSRELLTHELFDKLIGARHQAGAKIASGMAELASNAGYDHPDRIRADIGKATEWFYSYANEQKVLRAYAFELWEGYYVGLYLFLASGLSCAVLLVLAYFFPSAVLCAFAGLCANFSRVVGSSALGNISQNFKPSYSANSPNTCVKRSIG